MCRKVVSVVMFLLVSWAYCWGEARPLATTQDSLEVSEAPTMTPSTLWQKADESLKIIEDSLIAQGKPVENLSKGLENLYQKSQELQGSVNALSQRFGFFEEYLTSLENVMKIMKNELNTLRIEKTICKMLFIVGLTSSAICIISLITKN